MSQQALSWCKERGAVFSVPNIEYADLQGSEVENAYRQAWFKKPLALLGAPFSIGIWIDLDCQINGCLEPIFNSLAPNGEIGLAKEAEQFQCKKQVVYNSGVLVFRKKTPILFKWLEEVKKHAARYHGDQDALSQVIDEQSGDVIQLPTMYNALKVAGDNRSSKHDQTWSYITK